MNIEQMLNDFLKDGFEVALFINDRKKIVCEVDRWSMERGASGKVLPNGKHSYIRRVGEADTLAEAVTLAHAKMFGQNEEKA